MFTHISPPLPELKLERVEIDGRRHYATPTGKKYPSITTVLGADPEKRKFLAEWRNKVGHEEAKKITQRASTRGTNLHGILERYVANEQLNLDPIDQMRFDDFKHVLDPVSNVHIQEKFLFSDRLRMAGTPDLVAEYVTLETDEYGRYMPEQLAPWKEHELSIIDYKTSRKPKKREWIHDYFKQATFYACCMLEKYQIEVKQIVILISVEGEQRPQIFTERVSNWIRPLVEARDNYERMYP